MLADLRSSLAALLGFCAVAACANAPASSQNGSSGLPEAADCATAALGVQVLGSGGPIAEGSRAGTSYVVWIDGTARLLVDAGPGSFIRFGEAGLKLADFYAIAFTHFHADHSGGIAGILNSGSFEASDKPLPVIGPAAGNVFPGLRSFLEGQFGREAGAWRYLGGYLDGGDGRRRLDIREIEASDEEQAPTTRIEIAPDLALTAIPVHHGDVPTLAYVVEAADRTILFAADQSAFSTGFDRVTRGLEPHLLVAHHVIPEGEGQPIGLHRPPGEIGKMAVSVSTDRLVLSHHMERSLAKLDESLSAIARHYEGPVRIASDGLCVPV